MITFPFSQNLFWDCNVADVDVKENAPFVIERVLMRGSLTDFQKLVNLYTRDELVDAITQIKTFDKKTAHFCSWYFKVPQSALHVAPFYD